MGRGAEVPDTSVFIRFLRSPQAYPQFQEALFSGRLWLSYVVLAELYAGTKDRADARLLDTVEREMDRQGRVLIPTQRDWVAAGRMVCRYGRLHGDVELREHMADVLIVLSAAQVEGTVLSHNLRHMEIWAELARKSRRKVWVDLYQG